MSESNLNALEKIDPVLVPKVREVGTQDLRVQLRDEIDRLALFVHELKTQADNVQKMADALGDQLLAENSDGVQKIRVRRKDGHLRR